MQQRLLPYYGSDVAEGLNTKSFAAAGFLYFATTCAAVAFGAGISAGTGGQLGVMEMIISTSICGIVFPLFSGQPVALTGFGGPHLAFTTVLYGTCQQLGLPFLQSFAWVGLWASLYLMIMTLTSFPNVLNYYTKFTDETFSALSAVVFIIEACKNLYKPFKLGWDPSVCFLTVMTGIVTAGSVFAISRMRQTLLFKPFIRDTIADFAPVLGVLIGSFFSLKLTGMFNISLDTLSLPASGFGTTTGRPWLIDFLSAPTLVKYGSAIPAIFLSILLFQDQNITVRLVNNNPLRKGYGYNLDLFVISIFTAFASVLGLPWMTAATVPSLTHARALSDLNKYGEVETLKENRISGALVHIFMGLSLVFLRPVLKQVPLAVFMGLFLYLGVSAAAGNRFIRRLFLVFVERPRFEEALVPDYRSIKPKEEQPSVIFKYTGLQLGFFALLWYIKSTKIGIAFPIVVAGLVPIRIWITKYFNQDHLKALDSCGMLHSTCSRESVCACAVAAYPIPALNPFLYVCCDRHMQVIRSLVGENCTLNSTRKLCASRRQHLKRRHASRRCILELLCTNVVLDS